MARVKSIFLKLLWTLRLGLFLLGPTLSVMAYCVFLLSPWGLTGGSFLALCGLLMASIALMWWGKPPLSNDTQPDSPRLGWLGITLFGAVSILLAAFLFLTWGHSANAYTNNYIGRTLYFVHADIPGVSVLFSAGACLFLFGVLINTIRKNYRQYRLCAWLLAFAIALYPFCAVTATQITLVKMPEWKIQQTAQGPDRQTYSFLLEGFNVRGDNPSALVRHTMRTPLFNRVEIILLDNKTRDTYGVLLQGMQHKDAGVREVCAALLKKDKARSRRDTKNAE